MKKDILNITEACELLGIKPRTMYSLLKKREVPAVKIGGQWRFSSKALLEMFTNMPVAAVDDHLSDEAEEELDE